MQPSVTVGFEQSFVLYHQEKKRNKKKSRVKDIKYEAVRNALVLTTVRITANLDKPEKIIHLSEYEQAWDISLGEN